MTGQRVTAAAAERLAQQLSTRDWQIIRSLHHARVLTGKQLSRLHFAELSTHTQHRTRRRVLERLTNLHILTRLDRVIGGVRAGSTGWVYALGPAGQRLVQLDAQLSRTQRFRTPWTPSTLFLKHSLDVAEVYVQLFEATCTGGGNIRLRSFAVEPTCWWPDGLGGFLKPDAFLVLSTAAYDELLWLEVDRATESLPTLKRKLTGYSDFVRRGQLGPSGVMPHVVITAPTTARAEDIQKVVQALDGAAPIFRITPFTDATRQLLGLAANVIEDPP